MELNIDQMSEKVNISSYHMIRKFSKENGLTPHKFQITSKETGGSYSYHLIRIAPGKSILDHSHDPQLETHEVIAGRGVCVNDGTKIEYIPGVISIMPSKVHHEVHAGAEGLYLFAKFMPALC